MLNMRQKKKRENIYLKQKTTTPFQKCVCHIKEKKEKNTNVA